MTTIPDAGPPTFSPEEINTGAPTRSARLKWAVVVDRSLDPGRMVNAVACIAATTGALVDGLIARGGPDAAGHSHPGLPWAGCTVLAATPDQLAALQARAVASDGVLVVDIPAAAQIHRIYDDYLAELAATAPSSAALCAVSIVGPRNRIDKFTNGLPLLG